MILLYKASFLFLKAEQSSIVCIHNLFFILDLKYVTCSVIRTVTLGVQRGFREEWGGQSGFKETRAGLVPLSRPDDGARPQAQHRVWILRTC